MLAPFFLRNPIGKVSAACRGVFVNKKLRRVMKLIKFLLVITLALALSACASDKTVQDPGAAFKGQSEQQIYVGGESALISGDYASAIKHFEALDTLYPFGKHAQQAQLDIIYAYYKNDDVASTLAAADRYIHLYPMGPYVDYAYYMRGLAEFYENHGFLNTYFPTNFAQRDTTALKQAFLDFSQLVYHYPNSKYTPDARLRMIYIRNIIASHELEVAHFYYVRQAYVAAANRANIVVQHYQQSTSVPGALVLMTEAYIKLEDYPDAQQSLSILKLNFAGNPNIGPLEKDLAQAQAGNS